MRKLVAGGHVCDTPQCQSRADEREPSEVLGGPLSPFVHPLISLSGFLKPPDVQVELGMRLPYIKWQGELSVCSSDRLDLLNVNVLHFASP